LERAKRDVDLVNPTFGFPSAADDHSGDGNPAITGVMNSCALPGDTPSNDLRIDAVRRTARCHSGSWPLAASLRAGAAARFSIS